VCGSASSLLEDARRGRVTYPRLPYAISFICESPAPCRGACNLFQISNISLARSGPVFASSYGSERFRLLEL
jgi:hypothetical protein